MSSKKTFIPCGRVNSCCHAHRFMLQNLLHQYLTSVESVTMNISTADVEHVARLARLELSEEEKKLFAGQMGAILGYVEKLKELDTEGVLPTSHAVPMENSFREDNAAQSIGVEKALANAPDRAGSFYRVPKVIE